MVLGIAKSTRQAAAKVELSLESSALITRGYDEIVGDNLH
jgi:hypothetical protein